MIHTGTKAKMLQGKTAACRVKSRCFREESSANGIRWLVLTITITDERSQLDEIITPVIDIDNSISRTSTSYVNLLTMRPRGVVSKYDIGARRTRLIRALNIVFAHSAPPDTFAVETQESVSLAVVVAQNRTAIQTHPPIMIESE